MPGKTEASIRGAGVGGQTAAKLLARYGSLEAALSAAAAGELKGWSRAAQNLLSGSGGSDGDGGEQQAARWRRNRQLFAANPDPSVVHSQGMQRLLAALQRLQPAAGHGEAQLASVVAMPELAWQHPLHTRRWRTLLELAARQQGGSSAAAWQPQRAATQQGLAVDQLEGQAATFYVCPCDVMPGGWDKALAARQGSNPTSLLMPLLHGAMRHHTKLVQRAGYRVKLRLPPGLAW